MTLSSVDASYLLSLECQTSIGKIFIININIQIDHQVCSNSRKEFSNYIISLKIKWSLEWILLLIIGTVIFIIVSMIYKSTIDNVLLKHWCSCRLSWHRKELVGRNINIVNSVDNVLLHSDVPVDLLDIEKNLLVVIFIMKIL